ncbi:endosome/lysosome-associated apoptosis and autophagy regulator 1 [Eucyclogobius newberryi]|uniref:endosome/lysosome-associated apoptosis and autophagy regulator 1 n=1 Tax=Eucyclogobius newberryi TaxID=166745 RepID=UPI003B5BCB33
MQHLGLLLLWLLCAQSQAELPICKQSDYHFEYTECDTLGLRWRVAVPNKADTCTRLPDPVKGTQCTFSCNEGEFLDMQSQECHKCAPGTYSLGTGVAFDEWDSLPHGFVTLHHNTNEQVNCANSSWTPRGEYIASNTDECTATLSYAVSLKKPGVLTFEYLYPDNNIYFEFFVQNDQCQSTESDSRWMTVSENDWSKYMVELNTGNNVLYWRTIAYSLESDIKPVLLKNIGISGVSYTSECFLCKSGTYSAKPGAARCSPCPTDTSSTKGATVCHPCQSDTYSEAGSGTCKPRPACITSDYFYTHTPCDQEGKTQLMYKWIEPKVCSETVEGAVQLPASGDKQTCPPCNPGFYVTNSSTCEPCQPGFYSNGTVCDKCPAGTEPLVSYEYKWWNTMPHNMKSSTFRREFNDPEHRTAWEVAGEYIYTAPGEEDTDFLMLTLNVPGYRLPQSISKNSDISELARITFVFETKCTADCTFFFETGTSQWNSEVVEQWKGTNNKESYSFVIQQNRTVSFTWAFQRTTHQSMERKYSADFAKLYSIHITNVIGGVASQCRHCALLSSQTNSGCVPCPLGHYMVSETGVCKSCPPNTVIRAEQAVGEATCVPCGPNTERNKGYSACLSDCHLKVQSQWGTLHYHFSPLSNITGFHSNPRFTTKGLRYFQHFYLGLCGVEGRVPATCVDNVTESGKKEVKGYICQSTVVPSDIRGQTVVSSQPVVIGDTLVGVTTETSLSNISSPAGLFPSTSSLSDVIFYYRSSEKTQACKQGRAATVRMRCNPTVSATDQITTPRNCSEGTCDGCTFHFLWESQNACPLCTKHHYREIVSACVQGIQKTTYVWQQPLQCFGGERLPEQLISACVSLDFWLKFGVSTGTVAALLLIGISCYFWKRTRKLEYKYSKLMMSSGGKECELPIADSCAIMEGEDAEDDYINLTKKSLFTKIKYFRSERTVDGFDSVPLKSSSLLQQEEDSDDD